MTDRPGSGNEGVIAIDVRRFVDAQGGIEAGKLVDRFVGLGNARYVTDPEGRRHIRMTPDQAMVLGGLMLSAVAHGEAVQLRNRVGRLKIRALDVAVWMLPVAERVRYAEEYQAEFRDVARGSRWSQWGYVLRLVSRAPLLGRELRRAAREAVSDR